MKMRASFRSQLVTGSVLWTVGLLLFLSMLGIHLLATNPRPHQFIYQWFFNSPMVVVLIVGAAAMVGGAWQIRRSLTALTQLHGRLTAVHRVTRPHQSGNEARRRADGDADECGERDGHATDDGCLKERRDRRRAGQPPVAEWGRASATKITTT